MMDNLLAIPPIRLNLLPAMVDLSAVPIATAPTDPRTPRCLTEIDPHQPIPMDRIKGTKPSPVL
jgi:hypothetical protein